MLPYFFLRMFPHLKRDLEIAHIKDDPRDFIKKMIVASSYLSVGLLVLLFFFMSNSKIPLYWIVVIFPFLYFLAFFFMMQYPRVLIRRRQKEIDMEILFAGRYLLVKIESGVPLFNAITDASKSYGVMSKYFREILEDIQAGMPIEDALENAREHCASKKFKKILSQLVTSLKTGVDIGTTLRGILRQISNEQLLEIKEYGKKMNAYVMMYMIIGVVVPSLGMTMLVVVASFLSLELSLTFILIATGILIFVQAMFITMFKSIRPTMNI